jgi:hypothetical protein
MEDKRVKKFNESFQNLNNVWIPLSERRPTIDEDGDKILIYRIMNRGQKSLSISIYDTYTTKFCDVDETWWMRLPKPPNH